MTNTTVPAGVTIDEDAREELKTALRRASRSINSCITDEADDRHPFCIAADAIEDALEFLRKLDRWR